MRYLLYGHGGSYNHGAEAITRCTIDLLRQISPGCKITLSTHFAEQDREFAIPADEFVERDMLGKTNAETYSSTIKRITADTVCIHIGGDNYCYRNWERWSEIHYAALERGAYSILWSCSIDPEGINGELLNVLKSHHLITARESITYNALIERGCTNVTKVHDIAFKLVPEAVNIGLETYIALNVSPLVKKKSPIILSAYQHLVDYILAETNYSIALVPHVVQPVDNDCDALQLLDIHNSKRVMFVSDKLSAAQYKYIISKAKLCVAARTHVAIAAYSSNVPTLAVGYSVKSLGIAQEFGQPVLDVRNIIHEDELTNKFKGLIR